MRTSLVALVTFLGTGCAQPGPAPSPSPAVVVASTKTREDAMSPMGRMAAQRARQLRSRRARPATAPGRPAPLGFGAPGNCGGGPDCGDEDQPFVDPDVAIALGAGQAETTIAIDRTGQHVVIGYNDFRGFQSDPISVSGVLYSDDGGRTLVDGGQLPSPGGDIIDGQSYPQIFGDPTVKYLGGCTFVYGSIVLQKLNRDPNDANLVQTMGVHRSTDCGHTWQGPFEVTAATNPSGELIDGAPADAADKEFLDVDPDRGRVIISWTNFASAGPQIRTAFSDDVAGSAVPTWSPGVIVSATDVDGQGSMPAFAAGSHDVYVAWARFPEPVAHNIGFARSGDDGASWEAPIDLAAPFFQIDQVLGNDRVHQFPSIAVDNSRGRHRGTIYVAYADNTSGDGADLALQRSTDGGRSFEPPLLLDSRPGHDRAQWFPSVSVDNLFGRVYVVYYDQGVAGSGDLTQTSYTFSDDGGVSWSRPRALTERPFHAAWGNDTSQPNLGDYIQGLSRDGDLFAAYAVTHAIGFADSEPTSTSLSVPDVELKHADLGLRLATSGTVQAGEPMVSDSGHDGSIDPGERITVEVPLTNYVTNPLNAVTLRELSLVAETSAARVLVLPVNKRVARLEPGATVTVPVTLLVQPRFVAGTPIDLALHVVHLAPFGLVTLHVTLDTGRRSATTLLAESFDEVAAGALPAGWIAVHGAGANVVPWTTSSSFCDVRSNGAFHADAIDGPVNPDGSDGNPTRWERLLSPLVAVPGDAAGVTLEFDVCYDTEDDPSFLVQAYDGLFLRIFDATTGRLARSVLVDAFASKITTGAAQGYPKHLPRSSSAAYFEDMSVWAGDSRGLRHVRMALPGMAGSTVQLRWEYTQDSNGTCSDVRPGHACGVLVDNIVMRSEKLGPRP